MTAKCPPTPEWLAQAAAQNAAAIVERGAFDAAWRREGAPKCACGAELIGAKATARRACGDCP